MTDERKNEIWGMLPENFRREATAIYKTWVSGSAASAMIKLFGKHNLTAQTEEKPKEESNHIPDTAKKVDYSQYRLDLAKEITVAVIRSDRWDFHSCNPVEQANKIVKRLKETEE